MNINDVLSAIAEQHRSIARLISVESDKVEYVLHHMGDIDELLCINDSVSRTIQQLTDLEMAGNSTIKTLSTIASTEYCEERAAAIMNDICLHILVHNNMGHYLPSAIVTLYIDNAIIGQKTTDNDGKVVYNDIHSGSYRVSVRYNDIEKSILINVNNSNPSPIINVHIDV